MQLYKKNSLRPLLTLGDTLLGLPRVSGDVWNELPVIVRWLVMVRAVVLVMTASSVLVGVLPALAEGQFDSGRFIALMVGLLFAHATNNLINDYVDSRRGLDTDNYLRRQYGLHVLEDDLVQPAAFLRVVGFTGAIALSCGLWLAFRLGPGVFYLLLSGIFFVIFYTWPLKHFALGELAVLLVWGPLMTAGSYFVMTGQVTPTMLGLSLIYGIGPTLVILGKHMDKAEQDRQKGVASLPVILGDARSRYLTIGLVAVQWLLIACMSLSGYVSMWIWLTLFSMPAALELIKSLRAPRPLMRPEGSAGTVWPLWYSAFAFRYTRDFGILLVAALAAAAV